MSKVLEYKNKSNIFNGLLLLQQTGKAPNWDEFVETHSEAFWLACFVGKGMVSLNAPGQRIIDAAWMDLVEKLGLPVVGEYWSIEQMIDLALKKKGLYIEGFGVGSNF